MSTRKIFWGGWLCTSPGVLVWQSNPALEMSPDEQFRQNKENGLFDDNHPGYKIFGKNVT